MSLDRFLIESEKRPKGRNRTINIEDNLHSYYKKVAAHYNVNMSTIITNILSAWKDENDYEIKNDMIRKLKE